MRTGSSRSGRRTCGRRSRGRGERSQVRPRRVPLAREHLGVALEARAPAHDLGAPSGPEARRTSTPARKRSSKMRAATALPRRYVPTTETRGVAPGGDRVAPHARDARAAASSRASTRWSGRRLNSSHYRLHGGGAADLLRRPLPFQGAAQVERADEPVEALTSGSSTSSAGRASTSESAANGPSGRPASGRTRTPGPGEVTGMAQRREAENGGSTWPCPRLAAHEHDATSGEMALISRALDRRSWPTIAVSG